jgi:hypothetical protein
MSIQSFFGKSFLASEELVTKSAEAVNTFHKVMSDLKCINEKSLSKQHELKDAAYEIEREIKQLEAVSVSNLKIISNIENILK